LALAPSVIVLLQFAEFAGKGAAAVVGASASTSAHAMYLGHDPAAARQPLSPSELEAAVARLHKQFLAEFDLAYVEHVIVLGRLALPNVRSTGLPSRSRTAGRR
jgi:hypothetical protein